MANTQEQVTLVPVIVVPIEVELTPIIVLVEDEHVVIAIDVSSRALALTPICTTTPRVLLGLYISYDLTYVVRSEYQL